MMLDRALAALTIELWSVAIPRAWQGVCVVVERLSDDVSGDFSAFDITTLPGGKPIEDDGL